MAVNLILCRGMLDLARACKAFSLHTLSLDLIHLRAERACSYTFETFDAFVTLETLGPFGTFETFETFGTFETFERFDTFEAFEAFETFEMFETFGTVEAFETFGTLETFEAFGRLERFGKFEALEKLGEFEKLALRCSCVALAAERARGWFKQVRAGMLHSTRSGQITQGSFFKRSR